MKLRSLIATLLVCGLYGAAPASAVTTADNASKAPESKASTTSITSRPASGADSRERGRAKERGPQRPGDLQPKR